MNDIEAKILACGYAIATDPLPATAVEWETVVALCEQAGVTNVRNLIRRGLRPGCDRSSAVWFWQRSPLQTTGVVVPGPCLSAEVFDRLEGGMFVSDANRQQTRQYPNLLEALRDLEGALT